MKRKTDSSRVRYIERAVQFVLPAVVGFGLLALPCCFPSLKEICLSLSAGFIVYFATVSVTLWLKRRALKKVLLKRHNFFKRSVLSILFSAEGQCDHDLVQKCMDCKFFDNYISSRIDESHSHMDAMMNGLNGSPSLVNDLNVEVRRFFDSVLLLASNASVSSDVLNRIGEYASTFKRMGANSVLKSDIENLVTLIADCFSDWSHVDGNACGFEHVIEMV